MDTHRRLPVLATGLAFLVCFLQRRNAKKEFMSDMFRLQSQIPNPPIESRDRGPPIDSRDRG
jgi:hypothetical protein